MSRYVRTVIALSVAALTPAPVATAEPLMEAGDSVLRHDLQVLADHGVLTGPMTSWPLAWGQVLSQIRDAKRAVSVTGAVASSIARVRRRATWETRLDSPTFSAHIEGAESAPRIRTFQNTPRESVEVGVGVSYTSNMVSWNLRAQAVDQSAGSGEFRLDGSMLGIAIGNYSLAVSTLNRWWGPGWDGSLILSSNARPIPAISVDRIATEAFESDWLSWIGPWDVSLIMGELESQRAVPNAKFFGMRFGFRPLPSFELGLSRTAQWCGDDRPCDAGTFADLLAGRDNVGDGGIEGINEPGNQLAGVDFRWAPGLFGRPAALYGQFIGEDEAGGLPSRFIGLVGAETSGLIGSWSWRWFGEFSGTACQFYESSKRFDCAYNHGIYETGYRFRGRSIGHGADNDAELFSTGLLFVNADGSHWRVLVRSGELNIGGMPDSRNAVSPIPREIASIDVAYSHAFRYGEVEAGAGYQQLRPSYGSGDEDSRFYVQWRSSY